MITPNEQDLKDFIEIYKQEFWTKISEKEALNLAIPLLTITKNVLLPNIWVWKK